MHPEAERWAREWLLPYIEERRRQLAGYASHDVYSGKVSDCKTHFGFASGCEELKRLLRDVSAEMRPSPPASPEEES